jgi:hypothetical protein
MFTDAVEVARGAKTRQSHMWKDLSVEHRAIPGARASRAVAGKSLDVIWRLSSEGRDASSNAKVELRAVCTCMLLKCKPCMHARTLGFFLEHSIRC